MYPLFETIRLAGGVFHRLDLHLERMNRSRRELGLPGPPFSARDLGLVHRNSDLPVKCKVLYGTTTGPVEYTPYRKRRIASVGVVCADGIDYRHKYTDRSCFEQLFRKYPGYDEFILTREGMITDATFSNLAFFDGEAWFTPGTFLLPGTRRENLLMEKKIRETDISAGQIRSFRCVSFINAMLDLGESVTPVSRIQMCPIY